MAYHNRKDLLSKTLKMLDLNPNKIFEVIVVDDASDEEHRLEDCLDFSFETTLVRINPEHKTHTNPCVPFNIGFSYARGDKIIIQNPECMHVGDLISRTQKIKENEYLSFHCYSFNKGLTVQLDEVNFSKNSFQNLSNELSDVIYNKLPQVPCETQYAPCWFNHAVIRPKIYHFASAILKSNLLDLGGFDERFASGIGWDDDELVARIKRKKMNVTFCNEAVIHLWHELNNYHRPEFQSLYSRNHNLYTNHTLKEEGYRAESSRLL